ncbi:MAG: hypothetical protein KAG97_07385, partial [Victivallales bacterium]|nr:hypothetical protein [Victivallales bacterium]
KGDEIILTTVKGQLTRMPADEVRTVGRASKGVRIMRFKQDGDYIIGAAKVAEINLDDADGDSDSDESPTTLDAALGSPDASAGVADGLPTEPVYSDSLESAIEDASVDYETDQPSGDNSVRE